MDPRSTALELARSHGLDRATTRRLLDLACPPTAPASAAAWLWRGTALLAAALGGLGIVMWVAANWDDFGRAGRFAILQAFVVATLAGAAGAPRLRAPLGLLALAGIGALFAYFGQTYQTGADPWQLFALWALLALPLCLAVRSEVTWLPWTVVVATAITLWMQAHVGHGWRMGAEKLPVHLAGWGAMLLLVGAMDARWRRAVGTGPWSWRLAATLFTVMVTATGIVGLFHGSVAPQYAASLITTLGWGTWMCTRRGFEVYGLSAAALGLNALVLCGLGRLLFAKGGPDTIAALLVMALASAALLAATVQGILRLSQRYSRAVSA